MKVEASFLTEKILFLIIVAMVDVLRNTMEPNHNDGQIRFQI